MNTIYKKRPANTTEHLQKMEKSLLWETTLAKAQEAEIQVRDLQRKRMIRLIA